MNVLVTTQTTSFVSNTSFVSSSEVLKFSGEKEAFPVETNQLNFVGISSKLSNLGTKQEAQALVQEISEVLIKLTGYLCNNLDDIAITFGPAFRNTVKRINVPMKGRDEKADKITEKKWCREHNSAQFILTPSFYRSRCVVVENERGLSEEVRSANKAKREQENESKAKRLEKVGIKQITIDGITTIGLRGIGKRLYFRIWKDRDPMENNYSTPPKFRIRDYCC